VQNRLEGCIFQHIFRPKITKIFCFSWKGNLYKFQFLCFGHGPAPNYSTKLIKIPIAILRRLNIRIVIYLDDMLILGALGNGKK